MGRCEKSLFHQLCEKSLFQQLWLQIPPVANPILPAAGWYKLITHTILSLKTKVVFCAGLELAPDPAGCAMSESQVGVFHMSPAHQGLRRDTIT